MVTLKLYKVSIPWSGGGCSYWIVNAENPIEAMKQLEKINFFSVAPGWVYSEKEHACKRGNQRVYIEELDPFVPNLITEVEPSD